MNRLYGEGPTMPPNGPERPSCAKSWCCLNVPIRTEPVTRVSEALRGFLAYLQHVIMSRSSVIAAVASPSAARRTEPEISSRRRQIVSKTGFRLIPAAGALALALAEAHVPCSPPRLTELTCPALP